MKRFLAALGAIALGGCATPGVTVSQTGASRQVLEASKVTRGRDVVYRAPVTIENAQMLTPAAFQDLQNHFLRPLQLGPWRYVIEGITLDAESEQDREWTLLVALDTGARIKVENFGAWDEASRSYFRGGYRRTLRGLEEARAVDPALDRYVRFWNAKRRKAPVNPPVAEGPEEE
jgi:hypothetical protein